MKKVSLFTLLMSVLLMVSVFTDIHTIRADDIVKVDFDEKQQGFSAVLYDNTNGLPTSEANAIVETQEGFIWIGSYSGLIRYDGSNFERYDSTGGLASIVSLYADKQNRLWIGTNDNGAAVMEKGEVTFYRKDAGLDSLSVRSISEDEDGNIYIATTEGMAYVDNEGKMHKIDASQIRNEFIKELRSKDNIIYGLTTSDIIFRLENQKMTGYFSRNQTGIENITCIYPDGDGYLYLGNERSVIYYGKPDEGMKDALEYDVSPLVNINAIEKFDDKVWICADNGIGYIDDDGFRQITNIPLNNSIGKIMADYQGNLWFTSSRQGLMKVVPNQFLDLFERFDLEAGVVNTTCIYKDILLIGSDSGLVALDENGIVENIPVIEAKTAGGNKVEAKDLLTFFTGKRIRSIISDSKGNIWFSTYSPDVLVRYNEGALTCFGVEDGMPSDRVRAVYERKDGTIMAACRGGMVLIENDEIIGIYDERSGISNTEILTVCAGREDDMIMGSDGDGIFIISGSNVRHINTDSGLSSDIVMRIKKDISDEIWWIITSNSLAYMDENYEVHTVTHFPYSNNFDIYENSKGEMWILSSNGIYVSQKDVLLKNEDISFVYYAKENGLPVITTANSYSGLDEDGDLFIAGTTGVARVNIEKPFDNISTIKMAVPYLDADGEYIYPNEDGNFTIPASTRKLTVYDFVYTYSLINPLVTYHLDGFDNKVSTVRRSEMVPVSYTNLRGGDYFFRMELSDAMGHGSKTTAVKITKLRNFYETWWFNILCALAILSLIRLAMYIHTQRKIKTLEKKNQENKTLIREMVEAFAKTIDMKDKYTNGHSSRVAAYTAMLAREMGKDEETIEKYYNIALLHDIGKIGIPSEVLNKPGPLTENEFKIIKSHSSKGYNVLKDISIMPELSIGAGMHHERPDGKGYPRGLKEDEIPEVAQIIAVADTFDAMYSNRPYRDRMNFDRAVSIIKSVSGTQLSAKVVDAFLRLVDKGQLKAPDDKGGGTLDDIDNIHRRYEKG